MLMPGGWGVPATASRRTLVGSLCGAKSAAQGTAAFDASIDQSNLIAASIPLAAPSPSNDQRPSQVQPLSKVQQPSQVQRLSKLQQTALLWSFALACSAALVAAGRRWPDPLPIAALPVWLLLLLPPLLMALWLLGRWSLPAAGQGGQSEASIQEQR
jgi:hypothetical protein